MLVLVMAEVVSIVPNDEEAEEVESKESGGSVGGLLLSTDNETLGSPLEPVDDRCDPCRCKPSM